MSSTSTDKPTTAPTSDDYDVEPGPALRFFIGFFMLIVTLFVFSFAVWTYSKHLKRLFSACWGSFRENGIYCCFPCLRRSERDRELGPSPSSSNLLNDIIFDPDEEQSGDLTESLLT